MTTEIPTPHPEGASKEGGWTPGPWVVDGNWIMSCHLHVATIPRSRDGDWSPANARLIAAAPDLAASARATVSGLDIEYRLAGHDDDWIADELGSVLSAVYFTARAALSLAQGDTT